MAAAPAARPTSCSAPSIANVERIEIVEAASLGIAGLSGQVANIIIKQTKAASGQFQWQPDFRAHYSKPNLFRGNISYTGKTRAGGLHLVGPQPGRPRRLRRADQDLRPRPAI